MSSDKAPCCPYSVWAATRARLLAILGAVAVVPVIPGFCAQDWRFQAGVSAPCRPFTGASYPCPCPSPWPCSPCPSARMGGWGARVGPRLCRLRAVGGAGAPWRCRARTWGRHHGLLDVGGRFGERSCQDNAPGRRPPVVVDLLELVGAVAGFGDIPLHVGLHRILGPSPTRIHAHLAAWRPFFFRGHHQLAPLKAHLLNARGRGGHPLRRQRVQLPRRRVGAAGHDLKGVHALVLVCSW